MFLRYRVFVGMIATTVMLLMNGRTLAEVTNGAPAKIYYVDSRFQGSSSTGESWESAFSNLQEAIDIAAENGGEIWVRSGTYSPRGSNRSATFKLKAGVHLYGGFQGDETKREQRHIKAHPTILSGDIGTPGKTSDNCYHVVTGASESTLCGFTITHGQADDLKEERTGAGLTVLNGSQKLLIANCIFKNNHADRDGGALYIPYSHVTVTNCTFYSNTAGRNGGAISTAKESNLQVSDCTFSANHSKGDGGGVHLQEGTSVWIKDSIFLHNVAAGSGGAFSATSKEQSERPVKLTSCTFRENTSQGHGGALHFEGPFFPTISACTFNFNIAATDGAISLLNHCAALIVDCTFGRNRGSKGAENVGIDESSTFVDSEEKLAELRPEETPPPQKSESRRLAPNIAVFDVESRKRLAFQKVIADHPFSLIILGDITNPDFVRNYRAFEAIALNYASDDFQVYYIQRRPTHPENHGFLQPFNQAEAIQLAKESIRLLNTHIPWLCDTANHDVSTQLPQTESENVFIYVADGRQLFAGTITDPASIQKSLAEFMGPPSRQIRTNQIPKPEVEPVEVIPNEATKRVNFNPPSQKFSPIQVNPRESTAPHYVKLRAEADEALLSSGSGKLYLGFHVDPLYKGEWDNSTKPLKYTIISTGGSVTPAVKSAPKVREASDSEPREFVLTATHTNYDLPIMLKVDYTIYLAGPKSTVQVSQIYDIYLRKDPLGGKAYRRQIAYRDPVLPAIEVRMPSALYEYDENNDGKIERNELKGTLWVKFPDIDTNRDGFLSDSEYRTYLRNR